MGHLIPLECGCPTRSETLKAEGKMLATEPDSPPYLRDESCLGKICAGCNAVMVAA